MATSVLMASEDATRRGSEKNHGGGFGVSSRPEKAKEGGRRKSKLNNDGAQKMKKQPQRGMGVEKLERMRMQEMTSTNNNNNNNNNPSPLLQYSLNLRTLPQDRYFLPSSFADPMQAAVPAKFVGNASSYGSPMMSGVVVGQSGLNHHLLINQGIGNGGFTGGLVGGYATVNGNGRADLHGLRGASTRWCSQAAAGNVVGETSKELSSIPNTNTYFSYDHCDLCHKKKKPPNGMRDLFGNAYQINSSGFLGLNQNINSTSGSDYGGGSEDQNGGFVAVQNKGGSGFMEYEFFPAGKGGSGTCSKEGEEELLELGSSSSSSAASVVAVAGAVGRGGAPNCFTTTTTATCTGFDASNSIDLSLKLSY